MRLLLLTAVTLTLINGCTHQQPMHPAIVERIQPLAELGAPLESEEGAVRSQARRRSRSWGRGLIAALQYVSRQLGNDWPLLVPLSVKQIGQVGHLFTQTLLPATSVDYRKRHKPSIYDRTTKSPAILLFVGGAEVSGDQASALVGYTLTMPIHYKCRLVKANGKWHVVSAESHQVNFLPL